MAKGQGKKAKKSDSAFIQAFEKLLNAGSVSFDAAEFFRTHSDVLMPLLMACSRNKGKFTIDLLREHLPNGLEGIDGEHAAEELLRFLKEKADSYKITIVGGAHKPKRGNTGQVTDAPSPGKTSGDDITVTWRSDSATAVIVEKIGSGNARKAKEAIEEALKTRRPSDLKKWFWGTHRVKASYPQALATIKHLGVEYTPTRGKKP